MNTVSIPIDEYQNMLQQLNLLKKQEMLKQVNELIELLYQSKYGLYLGDYTDDLTEYVLTSTNDLVGDCWNDV